MTPSDAPVPVRPAAAADLPVLAELRWEFRTDGAEPTETRAAFTTRFRARMAPALADGSWRAWVACAGRAGTLVGHVFAARIAKLPNPVDEPEWHLYVSNLYVRPDFRGRGIAGRLLGAALASAGDADAAILWARPEADGLYRRHGFGASPELMVRRPA